MWFQQEVEGSCDCSVPSLLASYANRGLAFEGRLPCMLRLDLQLPLPNHFKRRPIRSCVSSFKKSNEYLEGQDQGRKACEESITESRCVKRVLGSLLGCLRVPGDKAGFPKLGAWV